MTTWNEFTPWQDRRAQWMLVMDDNDGSVTAILPAGYASTGQGLEDHASSWRFAQWRSQNSLLNDMSPDAVMPASLTDTMGYAPNQQDWLLERAADMMENLIRYYESTAGSKSIRVITGYHIQAVTEQVEQGLLHYEQASGKTPPEKVVEVLHKAQALLTD